MTLISCFIALIFQVQAGVMEPSLEMAIPFYKTPESPFPSGQASRTNLLDSLLSSSTDLQFRIQWNDQEFLVDHSSLLREIEITRYVTTKNKTPLRLLAETNSRVLSQIPKNQTAEVISLRGPWLRIKFGKNQQMGYVLTTEVDPSPQHTGGFTSLTDLILKKEPKDSGAISVVVNRRSHLDLKEIAGDWGLFQTKTRSGWARLSEVIGRSDFAAQGWDSEKKEWVSISSRNGASIKLTGGFERRLLKNFTAFQSRKSVGIFQSQHPKIPKGARVEIIDSQVHRWNLSRLKGHGEVWWASSVLKKKTPQSFLTTADLMKKNLSALSFDAKSKKGLASANGIYRTLDGKTWTKIDYFSQDNWPVCLHPSGAWFVGPFVSTDEGESFRPAIKWSEVVKKMQGFDRHKKIPFFRVIDIQALNNESVEIKVDTGIKTARLRARALSLDWTPLP